MWQVSLCEWQITTTVTCQYHSIHNFLPTKFLSHDGLILKQSTDYYYAPIRALHLVLLLCYGLNLFLGFNVFDVVGNIITQEMMDT